MRYFEGKPIELLAPAGNFEIFESIVDSGCDAIYFGGQQLNMRLIRKGFNFTDEELKKAVDLARSKGKLSYITVNNLIDFNELEVAKAYLQTLADIKPDALIVQDFAILQLIKELKLDLAVHASVMMNVHNLPMIESLKRHGVERVVLSRETTLAEASLLKQQSDMELEYFTHGDMCVAHGAQCYHSSMLFGMSSNRGKCLKPCRWWFNDQNFPLAVKDMCMYPYLPEMIHAGITSFKIEGRMREKEFITRLINLYADALDRYIKDPVGYDRFKDYDEIVSGRKRDLSTAYAFGKPGVANINTRFEGTGKFYSTGKMFSTPTEEKELNLAHMNHFENALEKVKESHLDTVKALDLELPANLLTIRVNDFEQAKLAIELGVDRIYLAADVYLPKKGFSHEEIKNLQGLSRQKGQTKGGLPKTEIFMALPRMMNSLHFEQYGSFLKIVKGSLDGLLISHLGALEAFKGLGLKMVGDSSMNVYNPLSATFYRQEGLSGVTGSLELYAEDFGHLAHALKAEDLDLEMVVQGRITTMYMEHDLYEAMEQSIHETLYLENEAGRFPVYKDVHNRCHMLSTHVLSLMGAVKSVKGLVKAFRIEAQSHSKEEIQLWVDLYQRALFAQGDGDALFEEMKYNSSDLKFTIGALKF